jgi:dTDP-4-dehydrorhamnose reductase
MKVAIIGSNGQLGTDLKEVLSHEHDVTGLTHSDVEIADISNLKKVISSLKPEIVLNTAAYNLVPEAEREPAAAFQINATGPLNLAKVCNDLGIRLVHYSTDYVFDGKKQQPYYETDCPNPLNVYGGSKLAGEYFVLNYSDKSYVVRVSGIYGKVPSRAKAGNFVTTMIKLAQEKSEVRVVHDEILTPTPTYHIARNTASLIKTDAFGLYHMTCEGQCSWYEFAKVIWETLQIKTPLRRASVQDFPIVVKRPFYSVLENYNLNKLRINQMPAWKDALVEFLKGGHASKASI